MVKIQLWIMTHVKSRRREAVGALQVAKLLANGNSSTQADHDKDGY